MKVIKKGTPPGERIWKGQCRQCGSEVEALQKELSDINFGDYRSEGPFCWMTCPVCNAGMKNGYGGVCFYPTKK